MREGLRGCNLAKKVQVASIIHPKILENFPKLNEEQKLAIASTEGPVQIIAGPGSGKTFVLVLRTLNILLRELAKPDEIVLCTYTEKAAYELRDRLSDYAKRLDYNGNLSEVNLGTIHGVSNDFVLKNRHFTDLGNSYDVLDNLTQVLFIYDKFGGITGQNAKPYYGRWESKWWTIEAIRNYFNKITEEQVEPKKLIKSEDPFISSIGKSYQNYRKHLASNNKLDFALIQEYFLNLLKKKNPGKKIKLKIKYVLIDEYQDTNYIQERLLFDLASKTNNICVVGDEDQSLYRFRGATVRNILEFDKHYPICKKIKMTINYRSHKTIIKKYDEYMKSYNWETFRFDKDIKEDPDGKFPDYPAVFSIWGQNEEDEGERFADFVEFLKTNNIIEDYSQVALLLHSVQQVHSGKYTSALERRGIKFFCPRQRGFFETEEISCIVACFAMLFNYTPDKRQDIEIDNVRELCEYIDNSLVELAKNNNPQLQNEIKKAMEEVETLNKGRTLDKRLADFFYQFISVPPFNRFVNDENKARNLAIFSQLLNVFQNYYHYTVLTAKNIRQVRLYFFNSFLRLLHDGGINEYEDPNMPSPKEHVQVMTIHQSKGLEFPVVVVNSLNKRLRTSREIDEKLGPYYNRPFFEPLDKVGEFDKMRLHYVAFSRPEKILVLSSSEPPKPQFNSIWQGLDQWPHVEKDVLKALTFKLKNKFVPKRSFGFTSDLSTYINCPRQYMFFNEYEFMPSRSAEMFFGSLVHQTIEEIHRYVLDGKARQLNKEKIRGFFEFNFKHLINAGMRPLGNKQKELAFKQIMNYFEQNKPEMKKILETEVDVSVEKDNYILTGKIDLLMSGGKKVDILDFKAMKRPTDSKLLETYKKQLSIYGHIIETKHGKTPNRLILYWTGEEKKDNAIMAIDYDKDLVKTAVGEFDTVAKKILNKEFVVKRVPEKKLCRECDLKRFCINDGLIKEAEIYGKD